jgi:hypothetical protein
MFFKGLGERTIADELIGPAHSDGSVAPSDGLLAC